MPLDDYRLNLAASFVAALFQPPQPAGLAPSRCRRQVGRRLVRGSGWVAAFLAGWAILRALALVPFLGSVVGFVAVVFGLGALAMAIYRARTTGAQVGPAAPVAG